MGMIRMMLLGVLLASGIVLGLSGYMNDLFSSSGVSTSQNMSKLVFIGEIENATNDVARDFQNSQISTSVFAMPLLIATGVYDIIKLLLVVVSNIFTMLIDGVFSLFPGFVPIWVRGVLVSAAIIVIVLVLLSGVFKSDL